MGLLRFLLALAVAAGHAAGIFDFNTTWILPGGTAVQIFYIISGFLIAMILNGKYAATMGGNWIFYTNRIAKIFAPYLVIIFATILVCLISKATTGNALLLENWFAEAESMTFATWAFALLTNAFIVGQEWAFMLIYRSGELLFSLNALDQPPIASQFVIIVPAWTLSIELTFYALSPFILRRNILLIAALAYASYYFRFEAYHRGYYSAATDCRFFPFELSLFLLGSLSYFWYDFLNRKELFRPALSASLVGLVCALVLLHPRWVDIKPYQFYVLVALLLPALFDFTTHHKWDRKIGELSYPLYLVHWPIVTFAVALVRSTQPNSIGTAVIYPILSITTSIAAAVLINRYIVIPVEAWRQARVKAELLQLDYARHDVNNDGRVHSHV